MSIFSSIVEGVGSVGANIYNAYLNKKNLDLANENSEYQKHVTENSLGIRIADAERNGISKWSVVGDGATAGSISSANTNPISSGIGDVIMHKMEREQMKLATDKLKEEKENLEYQRTYAKEHALPIGIQPGLEQSILGWLDTSENRDMILDVVKKGLQGTRSFLGENPLETAERKIKTNQRHLKEANDKKNAEKGYKKAMKLQSKANTKASKIKPKERLKKAQSRNQGALPPGSIPEYIYRR